MKSFGDQLLAIEGDVPTKFTIKSSQYTLFLLEALHDIVPWLERHMLTIMTDAISKMAKVMGNVMSVGINVDWLDRLIRRIHKEALRVSRAGPKMNILRKQVKEAE